MLGTLFASVPPTTDVVAVEQPFKVPLIDPETGEVLERDVVGSLDLLQRDAEGLVVTVEVAARGRVRTVVIDVKPETKIIRFARGADGKGFSEQAATLEDLKPGWMVSVKTHHQGDREVADILRVVHEK